MFSILKNTTISANNYAGKFVPSMEEVTGSICVVTGRYYMMFSMNYFVTM